jgi:hypothetical protein
MNTNEVIVPKRMWIMPEYGKPYAGTVLRVYTRSLVAVVLPDDYQDARFDIRCIDLEYCGWASLDNPESIAIPDNITSQEDYDYYSAVKKECNL